MLSQLHRILAGSVFNLRFCFVVIVITDARFGINYLFCSATTQTCCEVGQHLRLNVLQLS